MKHVLASIGVLVATVAAPVLRAQSPPTVFVYTVPGVAKAPGRNGTHFVTDAVITNPGSTPAIVSYAIVPAVGTAPPSRHS